MILAGAIKWIAGTVQQKTGPVSYRVCVKTDMVWRRHADQMLQSSVDVPIGDEQLDVSELGIESVRVPNIILTRCADRKDQAEQSRKTTQKSEVGNVKHQTV